MCWKSADGPIGDGAPYAFSPRCPSGSAMEDVASCRLRGPLGVWALPQTLGTSLTSVCWPSSLPALLAPTGGSKLPPVSHRHMHTMSGWKLDPQPVP